MDMTQISKNEPNVESIMSKSLGPPWRAEQDLYDTSSVSPVLTSANHILDEPASSGNVTRLGYLA